MNATVVSILLIFTESFLLIWEADSLSAFPMLFQLMCTTEDLKEMGIPLGPRKKIAKFVKDRVSKQVSLSIRLCHEYS